MSEGLLLNESPPRRNRHFDCRKDKRERERERERETKEDGQSHDSNVKHLGESGRTRDSGGYGRGRGRRLLRNSLLLTVLQCLSDIEREREIAHCDSFV